MHSPILSASPRRARRLVRFAAAALCGIVTATAAPAHAAPTLGAGQGFPCGHYLKSPNGYFRFVYQCDGNLVLYDKANHAMWASNTNGKPSTRLIMQGDGNLVLYNGNKPVWASATDKHPGAAVRMQDDGNLVIFLRSVALWASRTSANCDQPKVCLYDGTTPSGYVVYDTTATTIANYASPLRRLHNGTPLDNHTSSIRNNSNETVCFYDGANYTGAKLCLAPHTSNANLGTLNNRISSHRVPPSPPPAMCPGPDNRTLTMDETLRFANLYVSCADTGVVSFTDRSGIHRDYGSAPQLVFFGAVAYEETRLETYQPLGLWQITGTNVDCDLNDPCCSAKWMNYKRRATPSQPFQPWECCGIQNDAFATGWSMAWDAYRRVCQ